jgi:hypothetical protein
VPLIFPLVVLKSSPPGSAGAIAHVVVVPWIVGVFGTIGTPMR